MKKNGFTLIELLAVIIIIGLLFSILIPKVLVVIRDSEKKTFANSVQLMINAASEYMSSDERTIALPSQNGKGSVVSIDLLANGSYIKKANNLANSVVVVYNNNGKYEYYAFATDGKYYVSGYKGNELLDGVTPITTPKNYITATSGITNYILTGNQLSY